MSFAIIKTGGKQYRVATGDVITVEKLHKNGLAIEVGKKVVFGDVLLVDDGRTTIAGTPILVGASVGGTVEMQGKTRTLIVGKFKNKTNYRKRIGHRHRFTKVKIGTITTATKATKETVKESAKEDMKKVAKEIVKESAREKLAVA